MGIADFKYNTSKNVPLVGKVGIYVEIKRHRKKQSGKSQYSRDIGMVFKAGITLNASDVNHQEKAKPEITETLEQTSTRTRKRKRLGLSRKGKAPFRGKRRRHEGRGEFNSHKGGKKKRVVK